ncbi:hypothetical protein AMAG_12836 [Allomyces macrogynus ATCC 38327]|uniref:Uncharacterized protein n=1 Tax=Allomyces macrogynus (strain ATCC 38327) TaxID=578462 RepID=A0A0L0T1G9_ALLM3|nr:hypothetical protein AMAG_12836 [Allomyces macrogynus ATCC 38327]|eukprot:KNE68668.1 hypothetical protein AMAG_12836 [Allomyces macrogynus ATCC 38327]
MKPAMALKAAMALFLVLVMHVVHAAQVGWPQGMLGATLMSPGLVYLPKEKMAFVFGGKMRANGETRDRIMEVAIIDLAQNIKCNDVLSPAVSLAPFTLPNRSWRQPILVIDNGNGVYETRIYTHGDDKDSFRTVWRIPDLLDPKAAASEVSVTPALPEVYFPAWSTVATPQPSMDRPAVYFYGNTTANGKDESLAGNNTLFKFTREGIEPARVESQDRPPGSGWGILAQAANAIVLMKGNDIWTYNPTGSVWIPRKKGLNQARSDGAAVVFGTDTRSFVIVVGGAADGPSVEYFDLSAPTKDSVSVKIAGDGPSVYKGALSMFLHDSHLFLVGGLPLTESRNTKTLLNIVRIDAEHDGTELRFTYVPEYTPSGGGLSTGAIVWIVVGSIAGLVVIGGLIYWFRRRTKELYDSTLGSRRHSMDAESEHMVIDVARPGQHISMPPSPAAFEPKKPLVSNMTEHNRMHAQAPVVQQLQSDQPILAAHIPAHGMDAGLAQQDEVSPQQLLHHCEAVDEILATVDWTPASDQDVHNAASASAPGGSASGCNNAEAGAESRPLLSNH